MRAILTLIFPLSALVALGGPEAAAGAGRTMPEDLNRLSTKEAWDSWQKKSEGDLLKLARQDNPAAQFMLFLRWQTNRWPEARAMLEKSAKAQLPQALHELGSRRFSDHRLPAPERWEGWQMMEKAAANNCLAAKLELARYEAGFGSTTYLQVKLNLARALEYLRAGADAGDPESRVYLALLYSSGTGEPRSELDSPHSLLVASARQGCTRAMIHLSDRYIFGHGEIVDPLEAARVRYLANRQHVDPATEFDYLDAEKNPKAQSTIALDDMARALSLLYKSDQLRDGTAAARLARLYLEAGKPGEAAALLARANDFGNAGAISELAKLEPKLTPEEKKEGLAKFSFLSGDQVSRSEPNVLDH